MNDVWEIVLQRAFRLINEKTEKPRELREVTEMLEQSACGTLISLLVLDTISNLISSSSLPVDCLFISRGCTNTLSNILPIHMERSQVTSFFGANALWSKGYTGANVRIPIFDTGIRSDHPHFHNEAIAGEDAECLGFAPDTEIYAFSMFRVTQVVFDINIIDHLRVTEHIMHDVCYFY
ncbi:hypothetical protein QVD17_41881 [Tagetes erecta]|uniref:Subtilisin n=1 Tax=Tagetes erecta TaxID=13708 RepID=A0AAD8NF44_TARER|nr:hypothetical protein QVD17_41881 [Tagetes erecta]